MPDEASEVNRPSDQSALLPGNRGAVEILEAHRVYHKGTPYPFEDEKPFFNIDAYRLKHRKVDGTMTEPMVREVFERGNSVGVLLYNRETEKVICVKQFRLPTFERGVGDGWVVETIAGIVEKGETPVQAAIDETEEETGYVIKEPVPIGRFYSSPGGTSELIHLFYADVTNKDRTGTRKGDRTEHIEVVEYELDELSEMLLRNEFVDPKLMIASYYLRAQLGLRIETDRKLVSGEAEHLAYRVAGTGIVIRVKTGDILDVRSVDVWLNPENRYMMMPRIIDKGLSAAIRWGGAAKYSDGSVAVDVIGNAIRLEMRERAETDQIIETTPGELGRNNGVRRLLHLPIATARGNDRAREGQRVDVKDIAPMVYRALQKVDAGNSSRDRLFIRVGDRLRGVDPYCRSVLIPLIGSGEGGLAPREVMPEILGGIFDFARIHKSSVVAEINLLAFYGRELTACASALQQYADASKLERIA